MSCCCLFFKKTIEMQRSEMKKSPSESQDAANFDITPEQFQNGLDVNKNLIEVIMENRKHGKFLEAAQYLNQLQNNLIFLTKSADVNEAKVGGETATSRELKELGRLISSDLQINNNNSNNPQQQNHFKFEAAAAAAPNANAMPIEGKNFKNHHTNKK